MGYESEDPARQRAFAAASEFARVVAQLNGSSASDLMGMLTAAGLSREVLRNKTLDPMTLTSAESIFLIGLGADLRLCKFEGAIPFGCWISEGAFSKTLNRPKDAYRARAWSGSAERKLFRGYWSRNYNPELGRNLFLTDGRSLLISSLELNEHGVVAKGFTLAPGKFYRINEDYLCRISGSASASDWYGVNAVFKPPGSEDSKRIPSTDYYEQNVNRVNGIECSARSLNFFWNEVPLVDLEGKVTKRRNAKALLKCGNHFVVFLSADDVRIWNGKEHDSGRKILSDRRVQSIAPAGTDSFFAGTALHEQSGKYARLLLVSEDGSVLDWEGWEPAQVSVPGTCVVTTHMTRSRAKRRLLFSIADEIRGISTDGRWLFRKGFEKSEIPRNILNKIDIGEVAFVQVLSCQKRVFLAFEGGAWLLITADGHHIASGDFPVSFCEEDALGRILLIDFRIGVVVLDGQKGTILFAARVKGTPVLQDGKFLRDGSIVFCDVRDGFRDGDDFIEEPIYTTLALPRD